MTLSGSMTFQVRGANSVSRQGSHELQKDTKACPLNAPGLQRENQCLTMARGSILV